MDIRKRLRNLAEAVKRERKIDTTAVERAKRYTERIKKISKTR